MTLRSVGCVVCHSSAKDAVLATQPYRIVRCRGCGHAYTDPRPSKEELEVHNLENPAPFRARAKERPIRTAVKTKLAEVAGQDPRAGAWRILRPVLPPNLFAVMVTWVPRGRVLELGVGAGELLDWLKAGGWETWGVDVARDVVEAMKARGHRMSWGDLDTSSLEHLPRRFFDLVVMSHVLEHLEDPIGVLTRIRPILKPGGTLLVCVPNIHTPAARELGPYCKLLNLPRHLHFFTPTSLHSALETAGYRVVDRRGKNALGVLMGSLGRMRETEGPRRTAGLAVRIGIRWASGGGAELDRDLITFHAQPAEVECARFDSRIGRPADARPDAETTQGGDDACPRSS